MEGMVKQWKSGKEWRTGEEKYKCKPVGIDRVEGKDRWVRKLRNIGNVVARMWGGIFEERLRGLYGFCLFDDDKSLKNVLREGIDRDFIELVQIR